jgi:hypothetical protein
MSHVLILIRETYLKEITIVDWSEAMHIANKYPREIEAARGSK